MEEDQRRSESQVHAEDGRPGREGSGEVRKIGNRVHGSAHRHRKKIYVHRSSVLEVCVDSLIRHLGAPELIIPGRYYAGFCDKIEGESFPEDGDARVKITQYMPFGVCAGIGWYF